MTRNKLKIAILGSGGREHALCKKLYESPISKNIFCFPGNAGTSKIATNVNVNINNFREILKKLKTQKKYNYLEI